MTLSEAIEHVAKLIGAFPNGGSTAGKTYIGALAAVLIDYPRGVAARCCDPVKGVARETRFLPTVADLVAFCDRETKDLRRPVDIEDHDAKLRAERRQRAEDEKFWQAERSKRSTLHELKAKHGPNWGITGADPVRPAAASAVMEHLREANRRGHEAMCERYGVDPNSAASPALLIALGKIDPRAKPEASE